MSASSLMSLVTSPACSLRPDLTSRPNTDEVVVWRLFYQPTKPVNMEVEIGGLKKLHGLWEILVQVVEMSSIVAGRRKQRRHFYALFSTYCYEQP